MKIGLISCVKLKRNKFCKAKDLYNSTLFKFQKQYVEKHTDRYFILSAKYGLLNPDEMVTPYNETMNSKNSKEKKLWTMRVFIKFIKELQKGDEIIFLAGQNYRIYLERILSSKGFKIVVPMKGLGIGQQLQYLKERI